MTLLDDELRRWSVLDDDLCAPLQAVQALVASGGKRLRPAFCHWGFVGAGGEPDDQRPIDAGAAFELLHAFALFHDDVMDGSATRRGRAHHAPGLCRRARVAAWTGESRRFGEGVAILVGDLAFVYADVLLRGAPLPAIQIWDELRIELNIGQYLDILGTARGERSRVKTERIARYKSGKYTVERPLHLGALLAAPDRAASCSRRSRRMACRSATRSSSATMCSARSATRSVTGKPVGDDIREGKPTPLHGDRHRERDRPRARRARARRRARSHRRRGGRDPGRPDRELARCPSSKSQIDALATEALAAARCRPVDR